MRGLEHGIPSEYHASPDGSRRVIVNVVWNSMRGGALGALSATANQGPCKDHTLSMLFPRRYGSMDRDGGGFEEGNSGWQNGKTDQSGGSESGTRMDSEREGDPGVVVVVVNMRRRKRREDERESEKREREMETHGGGEKRRGRNSHMSSSVFTRSGQSAAVRWPARHLPVNIRWHRIVPESMTARHRGGFA